MPCWKGTGLGSRERGAGRSEMVENSVWYEKERTWVDNEILCWALHVRFRSHHRCRVWWSHTHWFGGFLCRSLCQSASLSVRLPDLSATKPDVWFAGFPGSRTLYDELKLCIIITDKSRTKGRWCRVMEKQATHKLRFLGWKKIELLPKIKIKK